MEQRLLPRAPWTYTDDTEMPLALVQVLEDHGHVDPDGFANLLAKRYRRDKNRGYGATAHDILWKLGHRALRRVVRGQTPGLLRGGPLVHGGRLRGPGHHVRHGGRNRRPERRARFHSLALAFRPGAAAPTLDSGP
ncbi:ADP-ribosylglycohydrolase family protein [Corallococcus macrosporus]|uniref:ADP-ribosylglycohydrolase family protein n=1 Tax=Corallococcus macrosporus TaxID=35 RepID=A0ABS3DAP3_9BACT|nr:ADP-ribosylglycohydrolase family protein [Corallococcus macrosporus]